MKMHKMSVASMVFGLLFVCASLFAAGIWNLNDEEIVGNWTFNSTPIFNKAVTFNGAVAHTGALSTTGDLTVTGGDITGANSIKLDIGEATDNAFTFTRHDSGTVTLYAADNDNDAALTVRGGGSGALVLGSASGTSAITSSDWAIGATGDITNCTMSRDQLVQNDLVSFPVLMYSLRAADGAPLGLADGQTADHYLTYSAGAWGILGNSPNSSTVTDISEFLFPVPAEYVAGETITVRVIGMYTTVGDTQTLDLYAYEVNQATGAVGSDICATTIKTLTATATALDFTITPTAVAPGDLLSVVITTVFRDADGAVGEAKIDGVQVLLDIKG